MRVIKKMGILLVVLWVLLVVVGNNTACKNAWLSGRTVR